MNLRFYEAMATGSMLLANRLTPASGLFELFEDRKHLALYDDENLEDLVEYYLEHPEEREAIAREGHAAVLAGHDAAPHRELSAHDGREWRALWRTLPHAAGASDH